MIRTLYFICIIFVKKYNYILEILTVNHKGSYFPFFVFIQWVKLFCIPANFITIWSTVLNNKKKIYTTYVLVCQNCTLIFGRTRKQNWIISYVNVVCVYGGREGGWGSEVLKCFVRGVRIFSTCFVCVCGGGGGWGVRGPLLAWKK